MEDNLVTANDVTEYQKRSYDDLSSEFQRLYASAVRAFQLIGLMYDRLTLVEKLSHKVALAKICKDHRDLPGFSRRNIRRNLPVDNPYVQRRVRPSCPKTSINEANESTKLSVTTQEWEKKPDIRSTSETLYETDCPRCKELEEALLNVSFPIFADKLDEQVYRIPRERQNTIVAAMKRSQQYCSVIFDKNGRFVDAKPDVDND